MITVISTVAVLVLGVITGYQGAFIDHTFRHKRATACLIMLAVVAVAQSAIPSRSTVPRYPSLVSDEQLAGLQSLVVHLAKSQPGAQK